MLQKSHFGVEYISGFRFPDVWWINQKCDVSSQFYAGRMVIFVNVVNAFISSFLNVDFAFNRKQNEAIMLFNASWLLQGTIACCNAVVIRNIAACGTSIGYSPSSNCETMRNIEHGKA